MDRALLNSKAKPTRLPPELQERLAWMPTHKIFEETAAQHPDAIAISCGDRQYTYRETDQMAERVARFLVARGLPIEAPVCVFADRSPELLFAWVGILKAGCTYVPVDPLHPIDRLRYVMDELKAPIVLTESAEHPFGEIPGTAFVEIRTILEAPPADAPGHPRVVKPENLAYIIFTSGSTGRPKGVMLQHRGLVNFCYYYKHFHEYKIGERCAQIVRPGFDASVSEIAGMFFSGVAVFIPDNETMANPARLVAFMVRHKVTRAFAATPLGELIIEEEWPNTEYAFYEIQTGGDTLRKRPTKRQTFNVTNVYGPTENTNISTEFVLIERAEEETCTIPIGYPLPNTEAIILTENLQPVKSGEEGELFLGGVQLARGYLNRPDLTAEKFIPHPFDSTPGARLYRSGDLCRYRSDGAIEHICRIDFQVKMRGFRIELGEIETVLNARKGVRQAVVVPVLRDGKPENLAAFWVADPAHKTDSKTLQDELRAQLPAAMVPGFFVPMDVLPLSPNGKIDRKKLPIPKPSETPSAATLPAVESADELESKLAAIWCSVLLIKKVRPTDNFIDIGGTSLGALRIVSQIKRELKHDIPIGRIFAAGTVANLAKEIRAPKAPAGPRGCLVQIQAGSPGYAPIFGIHGFGGHIYQFYLLAKFLGPERPVYALRGSGLEPGEEADDTCAKMAARYLKEILPIVKDGPVHFCGYSLGGAVALDAARQLKAAGHAVGVIGILDLFCKGYPVQQPFVERMKIHAHTMLVADWATKKKYLAKRFNNISERIHFLFGKTYVHPEERRGTEEIIPDTVFWAHRHAMENFDYTFYDGEVALFRAGTPPEWPGNKFDDPNLGWGPYLKKIITFEIPGTHWTMIQEPNIRHIADAMNELVAKYAKK